MGLVVLVRHGQASFGGPDYDVLSPLGERQATLVGERLSTFPDVSMVVHGALQRQRHTAARVVQALRSAGADGRPELAVTEDPRWDEYDHEQLLTHLLRSDEDREAFAQEMQAAEDPRRAFQQRFDLAIERWTAGEDEDDYQESYAAFDARVHAALDDLLDRLGRSETAVVVTSGGVIGAVSARLLGLDGAGWAQLIRVITNTGVTKLAYGRAGTTLVSFNDHAHLEEDPGTLVTYR